MRLEQEESATTEKEARGDLRASAEKTWQQSDQDQEGEKDSRVGIGWLRKKHMTRQEKRK